MEHIALIDELFPAEILIAIFKRVDDKDRCRLCKTHRRWHTLLHTSPELWKRLDLSNRYTLGGDKFIELDANSKNTTQRLRVLFSATRNAESTLFPSVYRFTSLTRLDLSCSGIDLAFFTTPHVADLLADTLTHLTVSGCPLVTSGSLFHLHTLKSLHYLDISHCDHLDDLALQVISYFIPWVQELNCAYLFKVTEVGVKKLFRMQPGLKCLNLMGCCRIKVYPWAVMTPGVTYGVTPLRELSLGEDSRIQARGFWLLWCTFQRWDMTKLSIVCPFLETIRLNMVLFDLPADGLHTLLTECKHLKTLSLVIERNSLETLISVSEQLRALKSLDLTIHIGFQSSHMDTLLAASCLPRLKALKFHGKNTNVFTDASLAQLTSQSRALEYLELNGDSLSRDVMGTVVGALSGTLQSLLIHHVKMSNRAMQGIARECNVLRDLTITDLQVDQGVGVGRGGQRGMSEREKAMCGFGRANKLQWLVSEPGICAKLKKIELASYEGFTDKDLAVIPKTCPNLQLSFSL
ncbi:hypothetical protein HDU98_000796 [Podochytrium sp. JEL0797]|nr:hypothetical protein HDU98_000796 [Podochytrium sp. JEL0797]